jgi:hypothetical protein
MMSALSDRDGILVPPRPQYAHLPQSIVPDHASLHEHASRDHSPVHCTRELELVDLEGWRSEEEIG